MLLVIHARVKIGWSISYVARSHHTRTLTTSNTNSTAAATFSLVAYRPVLPRVARSSSSS